MVYFVRHLEKQWANNKKPINIEGYELDPPIVYDTTIVFDKPCSFIICSPFLRCRQTAIQIQDQIHAPIVYDQNLREFLGNQLRSENEWTARKKLDPITSRLIKDRLVETRYEFNHRVRSINLFDDTVVIITHGIVIEYLTGQNIRPGTYIKYQN